MILIVIILLLIILTFIWYLLVRNIDVETFSYRDNQIVLKFHNKYLEGERHKQLKLGHNQNLATYTIIDSKDHPDGIQLESAEYPGYFICFHRGKWHLQSKFMIEKSPKSIFTPMAIDKKPHHFCLVNLFNQNCLVKHHNKLAAIKYHNKINKNQLIHFKKI